MSSNRSNAQWYDMATQSDNEAPSAVTLIPAGHAGRTVHINEEQALRVCRRTWLAGWAAVALLLGITSIGVLRHESLLDLPGGKEATTMQKAQMPTGMYYGQQALSTGGDAQGYAAAQGLPGESVKQLVLEQQSTMAQAFGQSLAAQQHPAAAQETESASASEADAGGSDEGSMTRFVPVLGQAAPVEDETAQATAASAAAIAQQDPDHPFKPTHCDWIEADVNYPGNNLQIVEDISGPGDCCQECAQNPDCLAWTWDKNFKTCSLKGDKPRLSLPKIQDPNSISGQPRQVDRSIPSDFPPSGRSLFCWALMLPNSYEHELLQFQYNARGGIFACDEYAIYSNMIIEVAPGVNTSVVDSTLQCETGGEFKTALNTDIFMAVWDRVELDGRWQWYDWTVKVDPDSVFFADRLRVDLAGHREAAGGVYLNNCNRGMHGPLEVFSKLGVQAWLGGRQRCVQYLSAECSGPCKWGEDMFIDQCMHKVLNAWRVDDFSLLLEDHCDPPYGWDSCTNTSVVAYHPFKTVVGWQQCWHASQAASR